MGVSLAAASLGASILGGIAGVAGVIQSGRAAQASGAYQRRVAEVQQKQNELRAEDARLRGEVEARAEAERTRQEIGRARAISGSSGIDVNTGTPVDLQADIAGKGALNKLRIKSNAEREALGFTVAGQNALTRGQLASMEGQAKATGAILTALGSAANTFSTVAPKWQAFRKQSAPAKT